jgi:AcrR family transcriptional regulator
MSTGTDGPTKRTQQQRSTQTQGLVLDAAVRALAEHGYTGATTLRIQELAGVSRGRLLHHFPSRDALLVAAVAHLATLRIGSLRERPDWPDEPAARADAAIDAMWWSYQQPFFWASNELWLAARHHEELRRALLPEERRLGQFLRDVTDAFFGPTLVSLSGYPELREILSTSMRGVALTYAIDPRDPDRDPHLRIWKDLAVRCLLSRGWHAPTPSG